MGKFNLSEETFARGLMDNDFRKIKKNGRVEYAWGTSEHATIRGKETTSSYESKSAGQRGDIAKFQKTSQSWKIGLYQKQNEGDDGDGEADEAPRMAIEDDPNLQALTKKQWETAKSQMAATHDDIVDGGDEDTDAPAGRPNSRNKKSSAPLLDKTNRSIHKQIDRQTETSTNK